MRSIKSLDYLGNIAIISFYDSVSKKNKLKFAKSILRKQKQIKTVLEKKGKIKGRLRKISTIHLLGERTKEVLYRENNCVFRFNIDSTYFSPRLSNERKEISESIKKNDVVLVMFAGVGPFSIVLAKHSLAKKVFSNEINREANKYMKLNIELNKLKERVEILPGDIKRIAKKLSKLVKFNVIIMPRPQLRESFLKEAFILSKKDTKIYYYDFCKIEDTGKIKEKIVSEAKKCRKKIKIISIKHAGEIAPYKIRVRVDFKVIN